MMAAVGRRVTLPPQIPACAAEAPGSSLGFWRRSSVGVYNWFAEVFDATDLKEARALLDDLVSKS